MAFDCRFWFRCFVFKLFRIKRRQKSKLFIDFFFVLFIPQVRLNDFYQPKRWDNQTSLMLLFTAKTQQFSSFPFFGLYNVVVAFIDFCLVFFAFSTAVSTIKRWSFHHCLVAVATRILHEFFSCTRRKI